jgi:hypothetical protein
MARAFVDASKLTADNLAAPGASGATATKEEQHCVIAVPAPWTNSDERMTEIQSIIADSYLERFAGLP